MTLTYQYALAQVWLDGLATERDPHAYDLCDRHANRLTAPQGWQIRDRRMAELASAVTSQSERPAHAGSSFVALAG